jgi:hypothetical protein
VWPAQDTFECGDKYWIQSWWASSGYEIYLNAKTAGGLPAVCQILSGYWDRLTFNSRTGQAQKRATPPPTSGLQLNGNSIDHGVHDNLNAVFRLNLAIESRQ